MSTINFKFDIADIITWSEYGISKKGIVVSCIYDFYNGKKYDVLVLKGDQKYEVVTIDEDSNFIKKVLEEK